MGEKYVIQVEEGTESLMDYPKAGPNTPGQRFRGRPHPPHPMMKRKHNGVQNMD